MIDDQMLDRIARYVNDPANWKTVGVGEDGHLTWQFIGDTSRLG